MRALEFFSLLLALIAVIGGLIVIKPKRLFSLIFGFALSKLYGVSISILFVASPFVLDQLFTHGKPERIFGRLGTPFSVVFALGVLGVLLYMSIWMLHQAAAVICRFLLRLNPLRINKKHPELYPSTYSFCKALLLLGAIGGAAQVAISFQHSRIDDLDAAISLAWLPALPLLNFMMWMYDAVKRGYEHHLLSSKYILFLRRYNSDMEKSVLAALLRVAPPGVAVVLMIANEADTATWDPILVGFTGSLRRRPLRSGPMYFSAPLNDWKESVGTLMVHASCLVMDISEKSASLSFEEEKIHQAGLIDKTVFLQNAGSVLSANDTNRVMYKASWLSAIPNMLFGLVIAIFLPFFVIAPFGDPIDRLIKDNNFLFSIAVAGVVILYIASLIFYRYAFLRPRLTRDSTRRLREALHQHLEKSPKPLL